MEPSMHVGGYLAPARLSRPAHFVHRGLFKSAGEAGARTVATAPVKLSFDAFDALTAKAPPHRANVGAPPP